MYRISLWLMKLYRKFNPTLLHWATAFFINGFLKNFPMDFLRFYFVHHKTLLIYWTRQSISPSIGQSFSLIVIGICNPVLNRPKVLGFFFLITVHSLAHGLINTYCCRQYVCKNSKFPNSGEGGGGCARYWPRRNYTVSVKSYDRIFRGSVSASFCCESGSVFVFVKDIILISIFFFCYL